MSAPLGPFWFLVTAIAGRMCRGQQEVIAYLREHSILEKHNSMRQTVRQTRSGMAGSGRIQETTNRPSGSNTPPQSADGHATSSLGIWTSLVNKELLRPL